jgi:hypothetical protein
VDRSSLRSSRTSPRLGLSVHVHHHNSGGAERDRTADLLRARQALSQLSYSPFVTAMTRDARSSARWWVWADSNCRPHPYQGCALTT